MRIYAKTNEPIITKRRFYKIEKDYQPSKDAKLVADNPVAPHSVARGLRIGNRAIRFERNELLGKARQIAAIGRDLFNSQKKRLLKTT